MPGNNTFNLYSDEFLQAAPGAAHRKLITAKLPRKNAPPLPNQEYCYACHYPQPKEQIVPVKGFAPGMVPPDVLRPQLCASCFNQVSKCDRCGAQVPPEEFLAGQHARQSCLDCGPGTKSKLRVEQLEEFVPKSTILNRRRETVWQKISNSAQTRNV